MKRIQYVRWPGDADPSDKYNAERRRDIMKILQRGPQTLRTLIKDGYVSKIDGERNWYVTMRGPDGYHVFNYYIGANYVASVREHGSKEFIQFDDIRTAAAYFRALVDWDDRQDKDSLARIVKASQKAMRQSRLFGLMVD